MPKGCLTAGKNPIHLTGKDTLMQAFYLWAKVFRFFSPSVSLLSLILMLFQPAAATAQENTHNLQQRMDSLIRQAYDNTAFTWVDSEREIYSYNADGKILHFSRSAWSPSQGWIVFWTEQYTYNALGQMTEYVAIKRDSISNQMLHFWKESYAYNAGGHIQLYQTYTWNAGTGQWVNSWKADYAYNTSGQITDYQDYYWDVTGNQWVNLWKSEFAYTAGLISLYKDYYWEIGSSNWVNAYKAEYTYNTASALILYLDFEWNSSTSQWVNSGKEEYAYTGSGLLSLMTKFYWSTTGGGQWKYDFREEYAYNSLDQLTSYISSIPNQSGNQWVNLGKQDLFYDINQILEYTIDSDWNAGNGQWVPTDKREFSFDPTIAASEVMMPYWYAEDATFGSYMMTQSISYQHINSLWISRFKNTYHYTDITSTGLEAPQTLRVRVFPNPVDDEWHLSPAQPGQMLWLKLHDASGRLIMRTRLSDFSTIPLGKLEAGVYFYTIQGKTRILTGKLLKK
jgi:hypothetical protein